MAPPAPWPQPPAPAPGGRNVAKKVLGILLVFSAVALLAFVALLLLNRGPSYEYEDYEAPPVSDTQPDELDFPANEDEAWKILRENPIYLAVTPDQVNCGIVPIERGTLSDQELQDRLNEFSACLMRVFERPLAEQGITTFRPLITVYSGEVVTACGTVPGDEYNAFYCPADQMLYYHAHLSDVLPTLLTRLGIEVVLAHEFAHFMQGRSGITASRHLLRSGMTHEEQLAQTRRSEGQADCWAGQWIRANTTALEVDQATVDGLAVLFESIGDAPNDPEHRDHGAPETRVAWFAKGLGSQEMGTCNTWVVPDEEVR